HRAEVVVELLPFLLLPPQACRLDQPLSPSVAERSDRQGEADTKWTPCRVDQLDESKQEGVFTGVRQVRHRRQDQLEHHQLLGTQHIRASFTGLFVDSCSCGLSRPGIRPVWGETLQQASARLHSSGTVDSGTRLQLALRNPRLMPVVQT